MVTLDHRICAKFICLTSRITQVRVTVRLIPRNTGGAPAMIAGWGISLSIASVLYLKSLALRVGPSVRAPWVLYRTSIQRKSRQKYRSDRYSTLAHLRENLRSFDRPPLPPEDVRVLRLAFGRVDSVTGE